MEISGKSLEEFKKLWLSEFKEKISDKDAKQVSSFILVLTKAIQNNYKKYNGKKLSDTDN